MRRAVDMDEKNVEALYMLAFSLWKLGQYAESMSICDGINSIPTAKDDEVICLIFIVRKYILRHRN